MNSQTRARENLNCKRYTRHFTCCNRYLPVCMGYFPVMIVLRLGEQIGDT